MHISILSKYMLPMHLVTFEFPKDYISLSGVDDHWVFNLNKKKKTKQKTVEVLLWKID